MFEDIMRLLEMSNSPDMLHQLAMGADPSAFIERANTMAFDPTKLFGLVPGSLMAAPDNAAGALPPTASNAFQNALLGRQINLANSAGGAQPIAAPPSLGSMLTGASNELPNTAIDPTTGAVQSVPQGTVDALGRPVGSQMSTTPEQAAATRLGMSNQIGDVTAASPTLAQKLAQMGDIGAPMTQQGQNVQPPVTRSPLGGNVVAGAATPAKAPNYQTGPSAEQRKAMMLKSLGELLR